MNYSPRPLSSYINWANPPSKAKAVIAVDQAKFNLIWLVYPELDHDGFTAIPEVVAESMDFMDKVTRQYLLSDPSIFMAYWSRLDTGTLALAQHLPADRLTRMSRQALVAHDRIYGRHESGNVLFPNRWFKGEVRA